MSCNEVAINRIKVVELQKYEQIIYNLLLEKSCHLSITKNYIDYKNYICHEDY